jgi:ABC-type bacteriocin/lantibiotic exporter with double-glycine peptidase domain
MVLAHLGTDVDETALQECCRTTTAGTRADDVVACARGHGFDAEHIRGGDLDDLRRWLGSGVAPIAMLNVFPIDYVWRMHAVVVTGIGRDTVRIIDPAHGPRTVGLTAFEQAWQMNLNRAILISATGSPGV